MAYCTQNDLLKLIPEREMAELTAESGETPDAEVVSAAIAQADAEIDAYLAVRYVLPLAATPARVKALSLDMAAYHLYSRRSVMSETRRDKYKDAVAFLKDVAAGRAEIIGADGLELGGGAGDVTEISSAVRVFTRDDLNGF
jgi:phage gp36-like protein